MLVFTFRLSVISNYSATLATQGSPTPFNYGTRYEQSAFQFQFPGLSLLLFSSTAELWALALLPVSSLNPQTLQEVAETLLCRAAQFFIWDGLELHLYGLEASGHKLLFSSRNSSSVPYAIPCSGCKLRAVKLKVHSTDVALKRQDPMEGSARGASKCICFG